MQQPQGDYLSLGHRTAWACFRASHLVILTRQSNSVIKSMVVMGVGLRLEKG
jgi:hypothetical protein